MKQYLTWFDDALWLLVIGLQWIVLFVSVQHGLSKVVRGFVYFIGFLAAQSVILFVVAHWFTYLTYIHAFNAGLAIETCGLLWVLHDIFSEAFAPTESLPPGTIAKITLFTAIFVAVALTLTYWHPIVDPSSLVANENTLARAVAAIVACAIWSIVLYARSLRIPWRTRTAGIARGFLFYLTVQSFTVAIGFSKSRAMSIWTSRIGIMAYLVTLILWLRAALQRDISVQLPTTSSVLLLENLVARTRSDALKLRRAAGEGDTEEAA